MIRWNVYYRETNETYGNKRHFLQLLVPNCPLFLSRQFYVPKDDRPPCPCNTLLKIPFNLSINNVCKISNRNYYIVGFVLWDILFGDTHTHTVANYFSDFSDENYVR